MDTGHFQHMSRDATKNVESVDPISSVGEFWCDDFQLRLGPNWHVKNLRLRRLLEIIDHVSSWRG